MPLLPAYTTERNLENLRKTKNPKEVVKKFPYHEVLQSKAPEWMAHFLYVRFVRGGHCFLINFLFEFAICLYRKFGVSFVSLFFVRFQFKLLTSPN